MNHREILKHYGIRAQKSLGQNFLVNDDILETIAQSINITGRDILEIGPGYGALTEKILDRKPRSLTLIELDKKMIEVLRSRIQEGSLVIPEETKFNIVEGDILKYIPGFGMEVPKKRGHSDEKGLTVGTLEKEENEHGVFSEISHYSIIANIPYYITSPILFRFLHELKNKPEEMVILMQKEVGDKILRKKGHNHSYLSLALEFSCETIKEVCSVEKENFIPTPRVDSSVLLFKRESKYDAIEARQFLKITSLGFSTPRKKVLSNLVNTLHIGKDVLGETFKKLGLLDTARAEEMDIEKWKDLIRMIR